MTWTNDSGKTDKELMIEFLDYSIKTKHDPFCLDLSDQKALLDVLKEEK